MEVVKRMRKWRWVKRWKSGGGFKTMRNLKWVKRARKWRWVWRMREVEAG